MKKTVYEFVELIKKLRAPGGCPWDREQTHDSIKMNILEEAYETFDAIEEGNDEKTMDELGDVLMQVVFHAIIASEEGKYDLDDVAGNVYEKMVRRHPHVFGENPLDKSSEVLVKWDKIKGEEKGFKSYSQRLYDVIRVLPALKRAEKIQKRAANAGFSVTDKDEIISEIVKKAEAIKENSGDKEIGSLLFSVVSLARSLSVDPEEALEIANKNYIRQFEKMENLYRGEEDFAALPMEEKKKLWEKAKK